MHCEHREPWSCAVDPPRRRRSCCRTLPAAAPLLRGLFLGLLLALARGAHALPPPGGQQQQETLLPLVVELEASMHSSVLTELRAAAATIAEGPRPPAAAPPVPDSSSSSSAAATTALLGAPGAGGIPDSSAAVVGQVFQLRVPLSMSANGSCNDLHLTGLGKQALPSWLSWDGERCLLRGVALEQDKGVHHLSASSGGQQRTVFSLEVYPEERADAEPALLALQADLGGGGGGGGLPPFTCTAEEPVTVLTVILDADLTKMAAEERVGLLAAMRRYARVPLEHMRAAPVVNNRLFDMSAFMAGPGNAKKVVENGALLSWKVGCSLDQSSIPDISSVQSPAKDGSMSAQLGYPVVGWHIVNKKPPTGPAKRVRRQLYNTPTPVPSLLPPTTHPEPPVRVVPTPTSPAIAPATDSSATPVRGPLPLPVKPTIRLRDQMAGHTPALGPPQPTRVLSGGTTSSVPGGGVQPTATRPTFVEATAVPTPPSTTRKPKTASTKKPTKRPRVKSTTAKPAAPRSTTTTTTTAAAALTPAAPAPDNQQPSISNAIDYVDAWVGTYFEVKIPPDTFFDREDGTADNLRLTLKRTPKEAVSEGSWIQFNSTIQLLYGLPDEAHQGKHEYFLLATDKGGRSIMDAFEVRVNRWPAADKPAAVFVARFHGDPKSLDVHRKILLAKKLSYALGDRNTSTVTLRSIKKGSIVVEWTNNSLPQSPCPKEQITALSNRISDPTGKPKPAFAKAMEPEFKAINISVRGTNRCQSYTFVPPGEVPVVPAVPPTPTTIPVHDPRTDDVYLHTVIPAVVVAALLLVAGVTAMVCYRKKRRGKMTVEEQATFIKKGVPIIFADELDDSKSPPSSSIPLILQEEKPPLPPPEYPNLGGHGPHSTLLNAQDHLLLEDYGVYQDDDPNAPPYQPPPPFTVPIEGKGSRPKNMTSYRSPPPYVPP